MNCNKTEKRGTKREKERLGILGKLTISSIRKIFGQIKMTFLLSHLSICISPLPLHNKYVPDERCRNFGVCSLHILGMALDEAILYLLPTTKIALHQTEFVSSEHEKEVWMEERSHISLSWPLCYCPLLLLHSQWHERLTQPQWPPLTGCRPQWFSHCWGVSNWWPSRHAVLLQENAKCSLASACRSRANPGFPVCWGFTTSCESLEWACWPGASAVVSRKSCKMSELRRQLVLPWPEP